MDIVKGSALCDHIAQWTGQKLNKIARQRLLLRLDENNTGSVTLSSLQDMVKTDKIKDAIRSYTAGEDYWSFKLFVDVEYLLASLSDPAVPLLVWIDDDVAGVANKVKFVQKCGVTVVQLASTAAGKAWINVNKGMYIIQIPCNLALHYIDTTVGQNF